MRFTSKSKAAVASALTTAVFVIGLMGCPIEDTGANDNDNDNNNNNNNNEEKDGEGGQGKGGGGSNNSGNGGSGNGGSGNPSDGYGMITTVDFQSNFIYDAVKLDDWDYFVTDFPEGIQTRPAFVGSYPTSEYPIPGANVSIPGAVAVRDPYSAQLQISQMTMEYEGYSNEAYPYVHLTIRDNVSAGSLSLPGEGVLVVTEMTRRGGLGECVAAVGWGSVEIVNPTNTTAEDGGSIGVKGSGITLYHPTKTPDGDYTAKLAAKLGDIEVCPIRSWETVDGCTLIKGFTDAGFKRVESQDKKNKWDNFQAHPIPDVLGPWYTLFSVVNAINDDFWWATLEDGSGDFMDTEGEFWMVVTHHRLISTSMA